MAVIKGDKDGMETAGCHPEIPGILEHPATVFIPFIRKFSGSYERKAKNN